MHKQQLSAAAAVLTAGVVGNSAYAGPIAPAFDFASVVFEPAPINYSDFSPPQGWSQYLLLPVAEDLNGDGTVDFVKAHRVGSSIEAVFGVQAGVWREPETIIELPDNYFLHDVVAGDLNSDGAIDLVYWGNLDDTEPPFAPYFLGTLINNGDGTFESIRSGPFDDGVGNLVPPRQFDSLAVGDVTGDGFGDIVVGLPALSIVVGNGEGAYAAGGYLGGHADALELIDLDADGVAEVIALRADGEISVLQRQPGGQWETIGGGSIGPVGGSPFLAAFPPSEDETTRLAFAGTSDGTNTTAVGTLTIDGAFGITVEGPVAEVEGVGSPMLFADVLGTPEPDLVLGNRSVFVDPGGGALADPVRIHPENAVPYVAAGHSSSIVAADTDSDGRDELLFAKYSGIEFSPIVETSAGRAFAVPASAMLSGFDTDLFSGAVAAGDFDGNGLTDVCVTSDPLDSGAAAVFYQEADGSFTGIPIPDAVRCVRVHAADLDADGLDDLVLPHSQEAEAQILFAGPGRTFTALPPFGLTRNAFEAATSDLDGDGRMDVVIQQASHGFALLTQTSPRVFTITETETEPAPYLGVAIGDLDGDGLEDLALGANGNLSLLSVLSVGEGVFAAPIEGPHTGIAAEDIALADFDGDGDLDATTARRGGFDPVFPVIATMENNGAGVYSLDQEFTYAPTAYLGGVVGFESVHTGDLDGDGSPDLVVADSFGGAHVLMNDGAGVLNLAGVVERRVGNMNHADLADVNGDGRADLVVPSVGAADDGTGAIGFIVYTNTLRPGLGCVADIAVPAGVLDLADIVAFVTAFSNQEAAADLVVPFGVFDLADIAAFIAAFGDGCE